MYLFYRFKLKICSDKVPNSFEEAVNQAPVSSACFFRGADATDCMNTFCRERIRSDCFWRALPTASSGALQHLKQHEAAVSGNFPILKRWPDLFVVNRSSCCWWCSQGHPSPHWPKWSLAWLKYVTSPIAHQSASDVINSFNLSTCARELSSTRNGCWSGSLPLRYRFVFQAARSKSRRGSTSTWLGGFG